VLIGHSALVGNRQGGPLRPNMVLRFLAAALFVLAIASCASDEGTTPSTSAVVIDSTRSSLANAGQQDPPVVTAPPVPLTESVPSPVSIASTSVTPVPSTELVQELTFTIPAELSFRTDGFASTAEGHSAFYANFPLGPACSPGCGLRSFSPLPAKGIVIGMGVLSGLGAGGPDPANPAPNISVAGRSAVWSSDKPGNCGGDETVSVRIPHPGGNEYIVRACLRGPDLAAAEHMVQTMLASATLSV
jgi:hypothetical protein